MKNDLGGIDVLILCGGLGTRMSSIVKGKPKGLFPVGGEVFLDILIKNLIGHGFSRFILCVGHLKDQIKEHYWNFKEGEILFSDEDIPMGTGGAVKNGERLINSDTIVVMNGDSLCNVDFGDFLQFHRNRRTHLSFVLSRALEAADFGTIDIGADGDILTFREKIGEERSGGYINAGIYLMNRNLLPLMKKPPPFSLEYDFFPEVVKSRKCWGYVVKDKLIDIGTPERYAEVNRMFEKRNRLMGKI